MAKKSAKSKGYRRQNVKKPYLSKKEIGALCAAVLLLAIGAFFLFRYDDGALKVQDGAVVTEGDNWLIVNGSNVRGRARYFKLGEIGEIDGYSREKVAGLTDGNLAEYDFTPAGEDDGTRLSISCGHSTAEGLASYTRDTLESLESAELGELQTVELADGTAQYYLYTSKPAEAAAEEAEPAGDSAEEAEPAGDSAEGTAEEAEPAGDSAEDGTAVQYTHAIAAYLDAAHDSCVIVHAESRADTAEGCLDDAALTALMERAFAAVTLEAAE